MGPWYWTSPDGSQGHADSRETKAALSAMGHKDICAIIAGQSVRIHAHDIPKLRDKERLAAVGFAMEDNIACSLGDQHIVLGEKHDDRAAVITKAKMQEVMSALDEAGLPDVAIYADFDALSSANKNLALEDRVICARPLGHTLDKAWYDPKEPLEIVPDSRSLAKFVDTETAINLRQNDFAPRKSIAFSGETINVQSLGRLAAIFVLCGVSWLGFQAASARVKLQETDFIKSETSRLYTEATGQAAPPNPALAASRAMQSGPVQSADFLTLSKLLFEAVAQTNGIIIESVQYDKSRAELSLRIIYPGFASSSDLEVAVLNLGGVYEAGGVREQGGQFIGDATLRLGAGS